MGVGANACSGAIDICMGRVRMRQSITDVHLTYAKNVRERVRAPEALARTEWPTGARFAADWHFKLAAGRVRDSNPLWRRPQTSLRDQSRLQVGVSPLAKERPRTRSIRQTRAC